MSMVGPKGTREIALDDFFKGPGKTVLEEGELVKEFLLPAFRENTGSVYIKHTRRQAMDLPIIGVAARITISIDKNGGTFCCKDVLGATENISQVLSRFEEEELRCEDVMIAMGVVAPRPMRARKAEEALKGKVISEKLLQEIGEIAASEATPRDSVRGEAWYRVEMIKVLIEGLSCDPLTGSSGPDDTIRSIRNDYGEGRP